MKISESEFWRLTLREYDALLTRKIENDARVQFNAGIVAAAVYNAAPFGDEKRKAVLPIDFVPLWSERNKNNHPDDLTLMTPEEQRDYLLAEFEKTGMLVRK